MNFKTMKKIITMVVISIALVFSCYASAEEVSPTETTTDTRIVTSMLANSFTAVRLMTMPVTARIMVPEGVVMDLSGRLVTFTLGCETGGDYQNGNGTCTPIVATALTDSLGIAKTTVTISLPQGLQPYIVSFAGDDLLLPCQFIGYVGVNKR